MSATELLDQDITCKTKRAHSPELEEILFEPFKVLDHGFVRVIDYMGNDSAVVQAARVSYGAGTKHTSQDRGLIHYLMRHRHTTPFEMCEIKLHVKLPIFVARHWVRHRTASINEYSGRYSVMSNEFYIPEHSQLFPQSKTNKQGRDTDPLPSEQADKLLQIMMEDAKRSYDNYEKLLGTNNQIDEQEEGLARELARMGLGVNLYTEWYWKTNLHNLFHFLSLRADSHAQYEIRVYADVILDMVKKWVPISYEAFEEYRMHGVSLSRNAFSTVKRMMSGENVSFEESGMTKREWNEFQEKFNLNSQG